MTSLDRRYTVDGPFARRFQSGAVWYHFASQPFRLAGGTMATFVLVHPAWFGGWCWKQVTPLLRAQS
jgi:hypothetical protein